MTETYTCARCQQTHTKTWSDAEAMEEYVNTWRDTSGPVTIICDDCYQKIYAWALSEHPEVMHPQLPHGDDLIGR